MLRCKLITSNLTEIPDGTRLKTASEAEMTQLTPAHSSEERRCMWWWWCDWSNHRHSFSRDCLCSNSHQSSRLTLISSPSRCTIIQNPNLVDSEEGFTHNFAGLLLHSHFTSLPCIQTYLFTLSHMVLRCTCGRIIWRSVNEAQCVPTSTIWKKVLRKDRSFALFP